MRKFLYSLIFSLSTFIFITTGAFSQTLNAPIISISPASPGYGQTVKANISLPLVNLNDATIKWMVNGVTKKESVGEKSFSFQTETDGRTSLIKVIITDLNNKTYEGLFEVIPSEVDLILEPSSFVTPFYKGRSVLSPQGTAQVIAITNIIIDGVKISDNKLVFKWKKDGNVLSEESGIGKNQLKIFATIQSVRGMDIDLDVYYKNKLITNKGLSIQTREPEIVVYENNPLYGKMFNKALVGNINIGSQEEFEVMAYPFFFSLKSPTDEALKYNWYVNEKKVEDNEPKNKLLFRQTGDSGEASVFLEISNTKRILQSGSYNFNVLFSGNI